MRQEDAINEKAKEIQSEFITLVKEWPAKVADLLKNPQTAIPNIPTEGSPRIPLIYSVAGGLSMGLVSALFILQYSMQAGLSSLIYFTIGVPIGSVVSSFVLNLILSFLGKDPGFYKTWTAGAMMSIFLPIQALCSGLFVAGSYFSSH